MKQITAVGPKKVGFNWGDEYFALDLKEWCVVQFDETLPRLIAHSDNIAYCEVWMIVPHFGGRERGQAYKNRQLVHRDNLPKGTRAEYVECE